MAALSFNSRVAGTVHKRVMNFSFKDQILEMNGKQNKLEVTTVLQVRPSRCPHHESAAEAKRQLSNVLKIWGHIIF